MANEREVWRGEEQDVCLELCKTFRQEGVGFRVLQSGESVGKFEMHRHFVILVPQDFYEDAKAIVAEHESRKDAVDENDESDALPEGPLGAADVVSIEDRERRSRSRPEEKEMTVEVFSAETKDGLEMVALSLRGVEIECRVEDKGSAKVKLFVAPQDEVEAREIVREVQEGTPPT